MILALSDNDELLEPTSNIPGFCPICHSPLIPRLGQIRCHHWAHKSGKECDSWSEETDWHRSWKLCVDKKYRECVIEKNGKIHFADIRLPTGIIVEFQRKPLHPEVWREREEFYGEMIWVIYFPKMNLLNWDIRKIYQPTFKDSLIQVKGISRRFLESKHNFPVFLDFH